jgi:hypothetical protein
MPIKRQATANGKCQAKTKAGRPCAAPVVRGKNYCSLTVVFSLPVRSPHPAHPGDVATTSVLISSYSRLPIAW